MKPTRPVLRYFGGKWRIAKWIISHFPKHSVYCEPFGGAASVLLQKERVNDEIYNDVDCEIVNVFRVLRDPEMSRRLIDLCVFTPYSRKEFAEISNSSPSDPILKAHRIIFMSAAGFSSNTATRKTGHMMRSFRRGYRNYQCAAMDWAKYPDALSAIIRRLRGVLIEDKSGIDCIKFYDSEETLFYVDPPYVHGTRANNNDYRFEMNNSDHTELSECLKSVKGMVVLSGYQSEQYNELYTGWRRVDTMARGQSNGGVKMNKESIWLSPNVKTVQEGMFV